MSVQDERNKFTELKFGIRVEKASILSANDDLFDFVGECLVTLMFGEMTAAMTGAGTVAINETGSGIAIVAATTIDNDLIDTMYLVSGQGDALLNGGLANPVVKVATTTGAHTTTVDQTAAHSPILLSGGTGGLTIESTQTGTDATGEILWVLYYFPLDPTGRITAAA